MISKLNFFIYVFLKDFRTIDYLPPRREDPPPEDLEEPPDDLDEEPPDLALDELLLDERLTEGVLLLLGAEDLALELLLRLDLTSF